VVLKTSYPNELGHELMNDDKKYWSTVRLAVTVNGDPLAILGIENYGTASVFIMVPQLEAGECDRSSSTVDVGLTGAVGSEHVEWVPHSLKMGDELEICVLGAGDWACPGLPIAMGRVVGDHTKSEPERCLRVLVNGKCVIPSNTLELRTTLAEVSSIRRDRKWFSSDSEYEMQAPEELRIILTSFDGTSFVEQARRELSQGDKISISVVAL